MEMAEPPMTTLPDDLAREILVRLDGGDVATLFRCATACKGWRRLVAEPSFLLRLRRWWPPSLVGFFSQRCLIDTAKFRGTIRPYGKLAFVPLILPGSSPLGTRPRLLSSLVPAGDATAVVDGSMLLDMRGGFLVIRLYPHDQDMLSNIVWLAVCDLIAGTLDVLPALDCNTEFTYLYLHCPYSCAIVPSGPRPTTAFRVLMIGKDKEKPQFNLHTFVSGEASWRAPIKCFDTTMEEHNILSMRHRKAVLCRGYAHWLLDSSPNYFHILSYNIEKERVSMTKLQSPTKILPTIMGEDYRPAQRAFSRSLTTTAGGTLLSLRVYHGGQLEIWTHNPDNGYDGDAMWERSRAIDHKLIELIQQLEQPYCIWEAESSGTLLIKDSKVRRFYKAYLDNGTLEEITNQFGEYDGGTIIPMETDWPTFFMVRLGGP